jgi:hypothetical protein
MSFKVGWDINLQKRREIGIEVFLANVHEV